MNDVINDSTLFQSAINKNKMCCKFTDNSIPDMQLIQTSNKGFHDSLYMAYAQHLTFGLRPDHVWIMIMQSLSKHVELNAEKFRHLFTKSKKKEKLTVEIEHNQFIQFIDSMAKKYMGVDKYPWPQPGDQRVVIVIEPAHTTQMG